MFKNSMILPLLIGLVVVASGCNAGPDGAAGDDGTAGAPGTDGADGEDGANGEDGTNGEDGQDGADGVSGDAGIDGEDGEDGLPGDAGTEAHDVLVETENFFEVAYGCDQGYQITEIGVDNGDGGGTADDGILQDGEIDATTLICLADDYDGDGELNLDDICPEDADPTQLDSDFDGVGDACDDEAMPAYYAISRGNDSTASNLYSYNPLDNTVTLIGSTGHALTYIKFNEADGELYGMTRGGDTATDPGGCDNCLLQLDTTTAAATTVVALDNTSSTDDGPHSSMAFLSDGTLHTWNEDNDMFDVVDTSTGIYTELGTTLPTGSHGMCSTGTDEIIFINYNGDTYNIATADGARTSLGNLGTTAAAAGWTPATSGRPTIRGDCNPDTLFHIGGDIVAGASSGNVVWARLYTDSAPEALKAMPAPIDNLHCIAIER